MRLLALTAALVALASPAIAAEALVGATVIDGTGRAIENGVVVVEGERIACIGTRAQCPVPAGANLRDLTGQFVTPGLVDAHAHFAQTGWLDGRPDVLEDKAVYPYEATVAALRADPARWHRSYLCTGVTAVFDVGGAPWTVTGAQATDTARPDRAHVRAAGSLITHAGRNEAFAQGSLADQPTFMPMESAAQIRADVARLKALGAAAIKVWYLAPPPSEAARLDALMLEVGAAARAADLPLIVHATALAEAKTALRAGAAMLVHSVESDPVDAEFLELLRANDAAYAPTLTVGRNWVAALFSVASGEAAAVDDPNRCVDEAILARVADPSALRPAMAKWGAGGSVTRMAAQFERTGRESYLMAANLRAVAAAGGRIVLATDAGNPLTMHGPSVLAELEAMEAAGMPSEAVIRAATIEAARAMGMAGDIGSLEPGKWADLLVLDRDPRQGVAAFRALAFVMRAGVMKSQKDLQVR
jgi:imidazolonepropionase-like amidohydrolase